MDGSGGYKGFSVTRTSPKVEVGMCWRRFIQYVRQTVVGDKEALGVLVM